MQTSPDAVVGCLTSEDLHSSAAACADSHFNYDNAGVTCWSTANRCKDAALAAVYYYSVRMIHELHDTNLCSVLCGSCCLLLLLLGTPAYTVCINSSAAVAKAAQQVSPNNTSVLLHQSLSNAVM
eukprot:2953-Heterococcus_DN1.PRE.4